jgi:MFS transporter, DHA2 family, methylenomycin A resistance protein
MVSSVACGAAPGIGALVVARLVQGVGAAAAVPASLALLRAAYPRPAACARAIGVWGGVAGVAAAVGPVLGGVLVTALGWRAVFFVNAPVGLAAIGLTARGVPAPRPRPRGLDPAAQVTSVLALAALTYALIEAGRSGRTPVAVGAALVAAASGVAFVVVERRASCPMLPLDMFADRGFSGGNAVGLLINLGFYGQLFLVNLFFQQALGWSALRAGLALLPEMGMASIGSFLSGRVTGRAGSPRPAMVIGLLTGAAGLLGLLALDQHVAYGLLVVPLAATGLGMSFTMPAATTAVVDGAPAERAGLASGSVNAARQVGGVIGVAALGGLLGAGGGDLLGLRIGLIVAGAAFLAGAAVARATVPPAPRGGQEAARRGGIG